MRAACERSKGGGCKSPKNEGGRRLPFTAGLACFFAFGSAKARVATERNDLGEGMEQYLTAMALAVFVIFYRTTNTLRKDCRQIAE